MKNVTIVVATSLALVTTAMGLELARRQAAPPADSAQAAEAAGALAPGAEPFAKPYELASAVAAPAAPVLAETPAPRSSLPTDLPSWAKTAVPAPLEPASEAPMRDAAPLTAPSAAGLPAEDPILAAPLRDLAPSAAKATTIGQTSRALALETKSAAETRAAADPAKSALVKPVMAKPRAGKAVTERADRATAAPKAAEHARNSGPQARNVRIQHAARDIRVEPDLYRFSGSFGGCQYRGFVSSVGYRVESNC